MGYAHDTSKALATRALVIENRARQSAATGDHGRAAKLTRTAQRILSLQARREEASNIIELEAVCDTPAPIIAPEPSPLTLHPFEVANGEAALTAEANAGMMDAIRYWRGVLADPYAPPRDKRAATAFLLTAQRENSRTRLRDVRNAAMHADHMEISAAERTPSRLRAMSAEMALAGHTVIEPGGRVTTAQRGTPAAEKRDDRAQRASYKKSLAHLPAKERKARMIAFERGLAAQRQAAMMVEDDDGPEQDCDIPPEVRARRAARREDSTD